MQRRIYIPCVVPWLEQPAGAKPSIICRNCYGKPPFEGCKPCGKCNGSGRIPVKVIRLNSVLKL